MLVGASHCIRSWKRLRLLIIIVLSGFLALLIAPSAAVLLQPRSQNVPAGGTAYYVPATADQLWPSEMDGSEELPVCFEEYASQNIACPSSGFDSLRTYFMNFNASFFVPLMMWDTYEVSPLVFQSLAAKIPRLRGSGAIYGFTRETSIVQLNAITAIVQDDLLADWRSGTKNGTGTRSSAGR